MIFEALSPQRRRLALGAGAAALLLIMTLVVIGVVRLAGTSVHSVPQAEPGPVLRGARVRRQRPIAPAAGDCITLGRPDGCGRGSGG